MEYISSNSEVKFRPYDSKIDYNYVIFTNRYKGCWSYVGMQRDGQFINLQIPQCIQFGTILHVLLHTLGFFHEHVANVRNNWVKIYWENIEDNKKVYFQNLLNSKQYNVLYDYESIMHGGAYLHSKNGNITIQPLVKL
jgi:hypothetical protein